MTKDRVRSFIDAVIKMRGLATDEQAIEVPSIYPDWKSDADYKVGERVLYEDILYKVLTAHKSQEDWTPDVAVSLFAKILIVDPNVIPEWEQPDSTNAYMAGDRVVYNGVVYESLIDNNIWSPETYPAGWKAVE